MENTFNQHPSDCIKVVLFGPESTGKSTLTEALAKHYQTTFVPEYAREFLQHKWNHKRQTCAKEDLIPIAEGQMKLENELALLANKVLICDTDLLQTQVYSEVYYDGYCDPSIRASAKKNSYDLYFLCDIDVPWVADDLRDKPDERELMFNAFEAALKLHQRPYVKLNGSKNHRFKTAKQHIDQLIKPTI
jgi:NadR type nicotinamide-nucleotide adenylyltransferase